ncbi:MAG: VOC family protein [Anaerolineales bacterium]|nr:VOC family protein [Anaerolineales bacterium]
MTFAPLPKTTHIGHIHLRVTDLNRSASFYCDMLGMRLVQQVPGYASLSATGDRPALLILHENKNARPRPRGTTGLYHIAIRFPDRAALAQTVYHLFQQQWPFQGAADHKVSEAFYLPDPDGNGLELYSDRPRSEWAWQGDQVAMSTDPLDIDELIKLAESFATPWGGAHPGTDIGHIHLQGSDLD